MTERRGWLMPFVRIVLGSLVLAVSGMAGCSAPDLRSLVGRDGDDPKHSAARLTVQYRLSGTARAADVVYVDQGKPQAEAKYTRVKLPWTKSVTAKRRQLLYVSAQADGRGGSVSCGITVNGKSLDSSMPALPGQVTSCSGLAPGK